MTKHERNRFVTFYHTLVAILILVAGGALLGLGIWLHVTDNGGPLNLQYNNDSELRLLLNASTAAMVLGGFLLATAVVSLLAMARRCVGATFRIIYIVLALAIAAALGLCCVGSTLIVINSDQENVRDVVASAWTATVASDPSEVCSIEKHFQCRGFADNDCKDCVTGSEAACASAVNCAKCGAGASASVGCYKEIVSNARSIFRPVAIVSGILAAIVVVDALVSCCL